MHQLPISVEAKKFAAVSPQCVANDDRHGHQSCRCIRSTQRLCTQRGESIHFLGAACCGVCSHVCAIQKLRGHDTGDQESDQHEPINRVGNDQCVVGR